MQEGFFSRPPSNEAILLVKRSADISDRLSELMEHKGMSSEALANKLNVNKSKITNYLSGTYNFTLKEITSLELAFGADILDIISK